MQRLVTLIALVLIGVFFWSLGGDEAMGATNLRRCWIDFDKGSPASRVAMEQFPATFPQAMTLDLEFQTQALGGWQTLFHWISFDALGGITCQLLIYIRAGGAIELQWIDGTSYLQPAGSVNPNTHYFMRFCWDNARGWMALNDTIVGHSVRGLQAPVPTESYLCAKRGWPLTFTEGCEIKLYQARMAYAYLEPGDLRKDGYPFDGNDADVFRYNIDEGSGDTLDDRSATENDGTLHEPGFYTWGCRTIPHGEPRKMGEQ